MNDQQTLFIRVGLKKELGKHVLGLSFFRNLSLSSGAVQEGVGQGVRPERAGGRHARARGGDGTDA